MTRINCHKEKYVDAWVRTVYGIHTHVVRRYSIPGRHTWFSSRPTAYPQQQRSFIHSFIHSRARVLMQYITCKWASKQPGLASKVEKAPCALFPSCAGLLLLKGRVSLLKRLPCPLGFLASYAWMHAYTLYVHSSPMAMFRLSSVYVSYCVSADNTSITVHLDRHQSGTSSIVRAVAYFSNWKDSTRYDPDMVNPACVVTLCSKGTK